MKTFTDFLFFKNLHAEIFMWNFQKQVYLKYFSKYHGNNIILLPIYNHLLLLFSYVTFSYKILMSSFKKLYDTTPNFWLLKPLLRSSFRFNFITFLLYDLYGIDGSFYWILYNKMNSSLELRTLVRSGDLNTVLFYLRRIQFALKLVIQYSLFLS